jgi:hypothetical protein
MQDSGREEPGLGAGGLEEGVRSQKSVAED